MNTDDYHRAPSGLGPLAAEWKDKPHRLVYDLVGEVERLQRLLWLRHDPNHFSILYGDDGEMQCGACLVDFKHMDAAEIEAHWQAMSLIKLAKKKAANDRILEEINNSPRSVKLVCQDCGGTDDSVSEGFCPFASEIHNRDVPVVLCKGCYHERAMDI